MSADLHSSRPSPLHSVNLWIWKVVTSYQRKSQDSFRQSSPSCWHNHQCPGLLSLILGCLISAHPAVLLAWQPLSNIRGDLCVIALAPPWYYQLSHGTRVDCCPPSPILDQSSESTSDHQVWPFSSVEFQCTFIQASDLERFTGCF